MSDVLQVFSEAFDEAASKAAGAYLGEIVRESLTTLSYSALFATVAGEAAKEMAAGMVGPILRIFLKVLDPTQQKLDILLNEPLQTAVSTTHKCLAVQIGNENDRRMRDQQFFAALQGFEKAYSIASQKKNEEVCINIRLAQAAIARAMDTHGWVAVYLKEFIATLKDQIQLADAKVRSATKTLNNARNRQTADGQERASEQARQMLIELGPEPLPGQFSITPLGMELGVNDKTWRYARQGIRNAAKAPTARQLAELQRDLDLCEAKSYRLKAFARFWEIPLT
ncbi:MAG: hypothetical protein WCG81_14010 [Candidatus Angelobacter sp.]